MAGCHEEEEEEAASYSVVVQHSYEMDLFCCSGRNKCQSSMTTQASSVSNVVVIDLQCFKNNNNEFIVKEVCVLDVNTGKVLQHHVTQPPFDQERFLNRAKQRENYWLTKHHHGLDWNSGDIAYHDMIDRLRDCLAQCSVIYVKGPEKKSFVMSTLLPASGVDDVDTSTSSTLPFYISPSLPSPTVIDMSDIGCASLTSIDNNSLLSACKIRCNHHKGVRHRCALSNCTLLRSWLLITSNESPL